MGIFSVLKDPGAALNSAVSNAANSAKRKIEDATGITAAKNAINKVDDVVSGRAAKRAIDNTISNAKQAVEDATGITAVKGAVNKVKNAPGVSVVKGFFNMLK